MTTKVAPQLIDQSAGIGYTTGSGGTETQQTSKSTAVTLNKACGQIIMHNASMLAGASVQFNCTNSFVDVNDTVVVTADASSISTYNYRFQAFASAGVIVFQVTNTDASPQADAIKLNFAVIKGVTS